MNKPVRLHQMINRTTALGPGERCVVWFQGCFRSCAGCMSLSSRGEEGGYDAAVDEIVGNIKGIKNIEGVTISGGEPFMQVDGLLSLVKRIKTETNLGVILYSGYYLKELRAMNDKKVDEILAMLDVLIDGPYVDELNDGIGLRGSSNQVVHFLTDRYKPYQELYNCPKRNVEMHMMGREFSIVGVPDRSTLETFNNLPLGFGKAEPESEKP